MNASLLSAVLLSGSPAAGGLPVCAAGGLSVCAAGGLPICTVGAAAVVAAVPPVAEPRSCGWFESSWELQHGLAVSDLPDTDAVLAALWFPAWLGAAVATASGRLQ